MRVRKEILAITVSLITTMFLISSAYALQAGYGSSANIQVTLPLSYTCFNLGLFPFIPSYDRGTSTTYDLTVASGEPVTGNGTSTSYDLCLGRICIGTSGGSQPSPPQPPSPPPPPSFTGYLTLYSGWNLISVPYTSVEVPSPQTDCGSIKFYNWNVVDQKWDVSTSMSSAKAYWFYSSKSGTCQLQIKHNNQNITYSDISLVGSIGGWNAVGASGKESSFTPITGSCSGKISTGPLGWDPVNQKWLDGTVSTFKPFEGYWIKTSIVSGQTCSFSGP